MINARDGISTRSNTKKGKRGHSQVARSGWGKGTTNRLNEVQLYWKTSKQTKNDYPINSCATHFFGIWYRKFRTDFELVMTKDRKCIYDFAICAKSVN